MKLTKARPGDVLERRSEHGEVVVVEVVNVFTASDPGGAGTCGARTTARTAAPTTISAGWRRRRGRTMSCAWRWRREQPPAAGGASAGGVSGASRDGGGRVGRSTRCGSGGQNDDVALHRGSHPAGADRAGRTRRGRGAGRRAARRARCGVAGRRAPALKSSGGIDRGMHETSRSRSGFFAGWEEFHRSRPAGGGRAGIARSEG